MFPTRRELSGGSRPSDIGGPPVSKKYISRPFGPQFGLKIRGGAGPPDSSPGSATETSLRKQPVSPHSSPLKTFRRRGVRRDGCFRRLPCRIGNNTEQDTEVVKNVCAPFHYSTEGCEGKEYSDPPSQPTSKSELILFVSTFRHLFSPR